MTHTSLQATRGHGGGNPAAGLQSLFMGKHVGGAFTVR